MLIRTKPARLRYAIDARRTPEPLALPLVALLASDQALLEKIRAKLVQRYGQIFAQSDIYSFDSFTSYYEKEFGQGLFKQILLFSKPRQQALLAKDKHAACALERRLSKRESGRRLVNADPGFMTLSKIVLASTKDHAHRLYLKKGIYAELTLSWKGRSFERLPWSYPDYVALIPFLNGVRTKLHDHLRTHALDLALFR